MSLRQMMDASRQSLGADEGVRLGYRPPGRSDRDRVGKRIRGTSGDKSYGSGPARSWGSSGMERYVRVRATWDVCLTPLVDPRLGGMKNVFYIFFSGPGHL